MHPAALRPLLLLPLALLFAACVNTDAAIFVEPTVESVEATVDGGTLGVALSGNFHLRLHLGPRATGPSVVQLLSAKILDAQQKAEIIGALPVTKTSPAVPVTVALDSDVDLIVTFDTGTKLLPGELSAKLCDAEGVVLGGTIQDSLQTTATVFASPAFHVSGCK
ncbi:MAG: hypothetical protein ABI193_12710 [Minicystis sp.]